jgi:hypothetical protein
MDLTKNKETYLKQQLKPILAKLYTQLVFKRPSHVFDFIVKFLKKNKGALECGHII